VIYVSSAAIYGDAGILPIGENQPSAPIGIPGSSQMICERMIGDFARAHGIRFAILRSFAMAGVDDDIADDINQDRGFISNLMAVAVGLRPQVTIHGSNYTPRDGTIIRDYVHAGDFAQAILRALRALETGSISRIYNIGAGIGTTALELAHLAERISGHRIPIVYGPKRDDEAPVLIADSSLARVMLGWTPKESAADLIIRSTWAQWYNRHFESSGNHNRRVAG
jgi:UDP-glucose 4-epimerase